LVTDIQPYKQSKIELLSYVPSDNFAFAMQSANFLLALSIVSNFSQSIPLQGGIGTMPLGGFCLGTEVSGNGPAGDEGNGVVTGGPRLFGLGSDG
jgi:hypothetical protein